MENNTALSEMKNMNEFAKEFNFLKTLRLTFVLLLLLQIAGCGKDMVTKKIGACDGSSGNCPVTISTNLLTDTISTSSWSGPQTSMIRENGQPYLVINGSKIVPIFLAVTTSNNPAVQAYQWGPNGNTEYQLNLAQLNEVPLVEVTLDQSVILDEASTVAQSYLNTIAENFKRRG